MPSFSINFCIHIAKDVQSRPHLIGHCDQTTPSPLSGHVNAAGQKE